MAKSDLCVVYWVFNCGAFWIHRDWRISIWFHGWVGVSTCWPAPLKRHRKNGIPFTHSAILFVGTVAECKCLERLLRPTKFMGWNKAPGGNLQRVGFVTSEETKKKISAALKGRDLVSDERKEQLRVIMTGKTNKGRSGQRKPDEERRKISISHQGKKLSPEHNAKFQAGRLPAAHTGHLHSQETKETIRRKKAGVPVHTEEHKRELAELWKGNSLTKGKPWSAARRLAWLERKELDDARLICSDQIGLFAEQSASNNPANSGDDQTGQS